MPSSDWNGAFSAPKGYDLRTPYNVPLGEIKTLRVVRPFSISSYQKDTVTEKFKSPGPKVPYGFPRINPSKTYYQPRLDPCTGEMKFDIVSNRLNQPTYAELTLMKLYLKDTRIK